MLAGPEVSTLVVLVLAAERFFFGVTGSALGASVISMSPFSVLMAVASLSFLAAARFFGVVGSATLISSFVASSALAFLAAVRFFGVVGSTISASSWAVSSAPVFTTALPFLVGECFLAG